MENKQDWIDAGRIAGEVLQYGKNIAVPGIKLLELAEKIEDKIYALGGLPAFPVNLSINYIAAHYTPTINDELILKEEDILKIDVGVHINGAIGDNALTIGPNKELIKASRDALNAALNEAYAGNEVRMIGKAIQETIQSMGFAPIKNLSGHGLGDHVIHSGKTIPNYDNGDTSVLNEGDTIAIEPFATDGDGLVVEGGSSNIYRLEKMKPTRNPTSRKVLKFVTENYQTLPFAKRWVENKIPNSGLAFILLQREGSLHLYPQLRERAKGMVSQAEHSLIIGDKSIVTTKIE
jgi:methionyl aminopeptidase